MQIDINPNTIRGYIVTKCDYDPEDGTLFIQYCLQDAAAAVAKSKHVHVQRRRYTQQKGNVCYESTDINGDMVCRQSFRTTIQEAVKYDEFDKDVLQACLAALRDNVLLNEITLARCFDGTDDFVGIADEDTLIQDILSNLPQRTLQREAKKRGMTPLNYLVTFLQESYHLTGGTAFSRDILNALKKEYDIKGEEVYVILRSVYNDSEMTCREPWGKASRTLKDAQKQVMLEADRILAEGLPGGPKAGQSLQLPPLSVIIDETGRNRVKLPSNGTDISLWYGEDPYDAASADNIVTFEIERIELC